MYTRAEKSKTPRWRFSLPSSFFLFSISVTRIHGQCFGGDERIRVVESQLNRCNQSRA